MHHHKLLSGYTLFKSCKLHTLCFTHIHPLARHQPRSLPANWFISSSRLFSATSTTLMSGRKKRSLYEVFDLPEHSDKKAIKTKFYELSMMYHPDKNQDDEGAHARFLEINEAYSVLGDEARRKEYDIRHGSLSTSNQHRSKTGPGSSAYGSNRKATSAPINTKLRPDDWIQYRPPGSGPGGKFNRFNQKPFYNYKEHQEQHYGPAEQTRHQRSERAALYRYIYHSNMTEPKIIPYILLALFCVLFYHSGVVGMIWMEPEFESNDDSRHSDSDIIVSPLTEA
ncbi:hypothetical protein QVD99_004551 [Batrachochytrium dendrobatidis]|nr:hypothetical protein O5D80_002788 [Batrachochytrium dendrobatidis]KAK5668758.1 hypothetical protein QVD99_004551 [Batrachochytrium dendrobatidis]